MLIPMYFLIGIWGYERRIYAAVKFILYTMAGSVLMLIAIIGARLRPRAATGTPSFNLIDLYAAAAAAAHARCGSSWRSRVAFAIKVPLFPFHTWLPDAHVEAPTAGLGHPRRRAAEDGHLRPAALRLPAVSRRRRCTSRRGIAVLAVIGIIYGALVAMVQPDMKKLVAYSSVSHLGFVVLGLFA